MEIHSLNMEISVRPGRAGKAPAGCCEAPVFDAVNSLGGPAGRQGKGAAGHFRQLECGKPVTDCRHYPLPYRLGLAVTRMPWRSTYRLPCISVVSTSIMCVPVGSSGGNMARHR
jgi:hypothetical protein